LRSKIKECQHRIQAVVSDIRTVNSERFQAARPQPRLTSFTNSYDGIMDLAALVIEVLWDCCYREQGGYTAEELYSRSLPVKVVLRALPAFAQSLDCLIDPEVWPELERRLAIEAARTADARQQRTTVAEPRPTVWHHGGRAYSAGGRDP